MSLDPESDREGDEDEPRPEGMLAPVTAGAVTAWAVAGLVGGWLLDPVSIRLRGAPLLISWVQPAGLLLLAVAVVITAWHTWQAVHRRAERLEAHRAVNRLVLGRSAALVGALMAGGYAGYLVSWLGSPSEQAGAVMLRAALASLAAVILAGAGVWLERACRVPRDPDTA